MRGLSWAVSVAAVVLPVALVPVHPAGAADGAVGAATAVPLSICSSSDNGDPRVTSASLTPSTVDTTRGPATVTLAVTAADTGGPGAPSGVSSLTGQLRGPDGAVAPEEPAPMVAGADGSWTLRVALPRGARPGTWRPRVSVVDGAANVTVRQPGGDSQLDAAVAVTSVADATAPRLARVALDRHVVDSRRAAKKVTVTVRARDGRAGVRRVLVSAGRNGRSAEVRLHKVRGTGNDGVWRGTFTVPRWLGHVTWQLSAGVVDNALNVRRYDVGDLRRLAATHPVDRAVRVRSRTDHAKPTSAGVTLAPTAVDVTAQDQLVTMRVRARDAVSGVGSVRVRLVSPEAAEGVIDTLLHRTSGTAAGGVWQAVVVVPRCGAAPGAWTATVQVVDRAQNVRDVLRGRPALTVTAADTLAPRVVRTTSPSGAPVLDFTEDVTGLSGPSIEVVSQGDGSNVPGSWACADSAGSTVSCANGAVRRATFSPFPTLAPTGQLSVLLNPEHTLGVTDLAGNPIGRRYTV